ncbi:ABC transporter ATP-binding protein [Mycolicibacterium parafortuitum]
MVRRLEARNIGMTFVNRRDPNVVLRDLTFHADENEFVSFVGPSGCGKSTLFNIVAGLTEPTTGEVFVEGENTTGRASKKVGYVLQKDLLLPWRTIIDNVIIGLEVRGVSRKEAIARAEPLFESYNLTGYENALPGSISGGMRQRAALMRTLVMDPDVILMDEAYKALDYPLKIALESELLQTVKSLGKTVIFVTHDIEEAVTLSDRVYIMKARPGEIVSEIAIDLQVDSTRINERRLAPRFNEYYETIWRSIGDKAMAS